MNEAKVREALAWLLANRYTDEIHDIYRNIREINFFAISVDFSKEPSDWTWKYLRKRANGLASVDKFYYDKTGEHFLRQFNPTDKADMLDFVLEVSKMVNITK